MAKDYSASSKTPLTSGWKSSWVKIEIHCFCANLKEFSLIFNPRLTSQPASRA